MATLVDEFYSIFKLKVQKGDLNQVEKEVDEVGDSLNKGEKSAKGFGNAIVKYSNKAKDSLNDLSHESDGLFSKISGLQGAILGIAGAFAVNELNEHAEEVKRLADAYGLTTKEVSTFEIAASNLGVEFNDVRDAIFQTSKTMGAAFSGVGAGKGFVEDFKLDFTNKDGTKKSMMEVFDLYRQKTKKMNKQEQLNFIDEAGINENFLRIFQLSDKKYNELMKKAGVNAITDEESLQAIAFNRNITQMMNAIKKLARVILFEVSPAITGFAKVVTNVIGFLSKHITFIKIFAGMVTALGVAFNYAAIQAAIAQAIIFAIPLAIIAITAAIAAVAEDLYNFFTGGESLIGDFAKKFPIISTVLYNLRDGFILTFTGLRDFFTGLFEYLYDIFTLNFEGMDKAAKKIFTGLGNFIVGIFTNIFSFITDGLANKIKNSFIGDMLGKVGIKLGANIEDTNKTIQDNAKGINLSPITGVKSNNSNVKNSSVNIGTIEVKTNATDSKEISQNISNHLDDQLNNISKRLANATF